MLTLSQPFGHVATGAKVGLSAKIHEFHEGVPKIVHGANEMRTLISNKVVLYQPEWTREWWCKIISWILRRPAPQPAIAGLGEPSHCYQQQPRFSPIVTAHSTPTKCDGTIHYELHTAVSNKTNQSSVLFDSIECGIGVANFGLVQPTQVITHPQGAHHTLCCIPYRVDELKAKRISQITNRMSIQS